MASCSVSVSSSGRETRVQFPDRKVRNPSVSGSLESGTRTVTSGRQAAKSVGTVFPFAMVVITAMTAKMKKYSTRLNASRRVMRKQVLKMFILHPPDIAECDGKEEE